jgi:hypothetical protein
VAATTYPDLSHLQVVGGYLALAGLFMLREFASGTLKEAGKELWKWAREKRSRRFRRCCDCRSLPVSAAESSARPG